MTEMEAVQVLQSALSGPSARFDAERTLISLGWPPLAIRLARGGRVPPAEALSGRSEAYRVIRLPVPERVHAKLTEIARSYGSVESWAQDALARAAEEVRRELPDSGLWRISVSDWTSMVCDQHDRS